MRTAALLLAITTSLLAQGPATPKIKTLLITGGAVGGHDWKTVSPLLKKALEDTGRFDVRVTEEFRGAGPETLEGYELVVLNYYDGRNKSQASGLGGQERRIDSSKSGRRLSVR